MCDEALVHVGQLRVVLRSGCLVADGVDEFFGEFFPRCYRAWPGEHGLGENLFEQECVEVGAGQQVEFCFVDWGLL